jgi:hypothetical protein
VAKDAGHQGDDATESSTFVHRFQQNTLYLTVLMFNTSRQLLTTSRGMLPTVELISDAAITENFGTNSKDFIWLRSYAIDYENPAMEAVNQGTDEDRVFSKEALERNIIAMENLTSLGAQAKTYKFRLAFYRACSTLQKELGLIV